jgi:signal transduction histidine kinase
LASAEVYRTGRSARAENRNWSTVGGAVGPAGRRLGVASTVASPIIVEGRLWGTATVSAETPLPPDAESRLEQFAQLVATSISNAHGRAELVRSRRRIVAASDEARRRIERDLHDGIQQQLVSLGLAVRTVEADAPPGRPDLRRQLSGVAARLSHVLDELQAISRGIHPAILSQGGLVPALRTLARRSATPAELDVATGVEVSAPIEIAAYYVASEALANAAKHAQATHVAISLVPGDGTLRLSVLDDGIGGADPRRGSGLVGLADRVEALGGSLRVESAPGQGTHVAAEFPLDLDVLDEA